MTTRHLARICCVFAYYGIRGQWGELVAAAWGACAVGRSWKDGRAVWLWCCGGMVVSVPGLRVVTKRLMPWDIIVTVGINHGFREQH
jgi:hypothetical protein